MRVKRLPPWGKIRQATQRDAAELLAIYAPYVLETSVSFESRPPTVEEFAGRIERIGSFYPYLVWDEPDGIKGYAYASRYGERAAYDWGAQLSVYTAPALHGTGVAAALYTAVLRLLREQGVWRAYAHISCPNTASRRFHEKLGFQAYGQFPNAGYKLGEWHDVLHMELALREGMSQPAPVVSIEDLPVQLINDIIKQAAQS